MKRSFEFARSFYSKIKPEKISALSQCPKVANPTEYNLSQEEKDFYTENGYLLIKKLFDEKHLDVFRNHFTNICNEKVFSKGVTFVKERNLCNAESKPEDYVNKIQDILHDSIFMKYTEDPRLLRVVSQFIGEEVTALTGMVINKPPGSSKHPPHQDLFYIPIRPVNIIGSWTAIDPSTVENGCLFFVPGSHTLELLPHGSFEDSKKFFHALLDEEQLAPPHRREYLEMDPGDTVLFHPRIIHGSGRNRSKSYRKAITVHYTNNNYHYFDLQGTVQEILIREFEEKVQKNGIPKSYHDMWKLKTKLIKGVQTLT